MQLPVLKPDFQPVVAACASLTVLGPNSFPPAQTPAQDGSGYCASPKESTCVAGVKGWGCPLIA